MEKTHLPDQIESERILLKRHSPDLAAQMFQYVDQDRKRLREFLPWVDFTRSVEDEASYIRMTQERWQNHSLFDYGIFRKSDSLYMGNCGVHSIAWQHDRCELGYWILGAFEGQGYVSEAVRALENVLFQVGFNRIEIRCASTNLRSARVPRVNGYRLEGVLRQDAVENGGYRDTYVFGKLKNEDRKDAQHSPIGNCVDHVRLNVKDLARSKEWYSKALGVAPRIDTVHYVEFRMGQSGLALAPADEKSPISTGGQIAYWRVHDLERAIERFTIHGARIYRGPLEIENEEAICQLIDPMGGVIGLIGPGRNGE